MKDVLECIAYLIAGATFGIFIISLFYVKDRDED